MYRQTLSFLYDGFSGRRRTQDTFVHADFSFFVRWVFEEEKDEVGTQGDGSFVCETFVCM